MEGAQADYAGCSN